MHIASNTMTTNPTSKGPGAEFSVVGQGAPPIRICPFILAFLALFTSPKLNFIGGFGEGKDFFCLHLIVKDISLQAQAF